MIRVRISEDAIRDLDEGFIFYEAQEKGLGDYFVTCLKADIEDFGFPAEFIGSFIRITIASLGKTFPYGIFYTMEADCAVVWAVIDLRREPEWIRRKLSN